MQFINKHHLIPPDWDAWFTTANGRRTYDYEADYGELHNLDLAKNHLINEQNGLCAYCQKQLTISTASIEHIVPKSQNKALSTNYYNLVAVCKNPPVDPLNNKRHCDKERGNKLLVNIIMLQDCQVTKTKNHSYFAANSDGSLSTKHSIIQELSDPIDAFLNILNINHHSILKNNRAQLLHKIIEPSKNMSHSEKSRYYRAQFHRILNDKRIEYRQYLLIWFGNKIGIN